ncbi:hypothetical protein LOZ53_005339 [Ophidiomyces ophidiicola]|uniref:Uncharacterized protein n=1 Tax=Ophidiomyces ophidiicola TaxID=1387563 RepID=A0ACB8UZ55_9EURO|nr:uncharacterized protein LOZ57_004663 [Ophidiomyces ophidiicola]KAI1913578.1 hypothetical protein LOZ61_002717 [Ophidiomyces ophidiicola]KAI1917298.1 hypothetical protein LOZ64_003135 [Ophidiomyces ophidiicola]KAI1930301.1 hypothetical protein LOZ60_001084 [Ophidiomyces ophidiicola]KAI1944650.1 hypothetical protein LOZ57_004663 [Ophidiomyces ophidiicola]KAI1953278.1 hypothetical protein LOZ62_001119 [Ophidiomyces ophidiicola]
MSAEEVLARSAPQVASPALDQFILFGDSITQFASSQERGFAFQPAIQNEYIRRLDVINRGFSGYNTFNSLGLLPQFFPPATKERVRLMTVFFGANDAVLPPYEQHVPLDKYRQYLKDILTHEAVRAQNTKLLLLTPPPVNEYKLEPTPARSAATTKKYADACREVGTALKVPVVDIWAAFMKEAGWTEGTPLAGSKDAPPNQALEQLLYDGILASTLVLQAIE